MVVGQLNKMTFNEWDLMVLIHIGIIILPIDDYLKNKKAIPTCGMAFYFGGIFATNSLRMPLEGIEPPSQG